MAKGMPKGMCWKDFKLNGRLSRLSQKERQNLRAGVYEMKDGESEDSYMYRTRHFQKKINGITYIPKKLSFELKISQSINNASIERELRAKMRFQYLTHQKDFNFLKYYAFVIEWAAFKYNIKKEYIEFAFFFYEGTPFSKEEFNKRVRYISGARNYFRIFYRNGYIRPLTAPENKGSYETGYYILTKEFVIYISQIYKKITMQTKFKGWTSKIKNPMPPDMIKMIDEMNEEMEDISNGLKSQEKIHYSNFNT